MTGIDYPDMLYAVVLGTMVIFGVKYISGVFKAWALGANEKQYRVLAEKVLTLQGQSQAALPAHLAQLASSLARSRRS